MTVRVLFVMRVKVLSAMTVSVIVRRLPRLLLSLAMTVSVAVRI